MDCFIDYKENLIAKRIHEYVDSLKKIYTYAEDSQVKSWEVLFNDLISSKSFNALCNRLIIAIEYSLPVDGMAADLLICGKTKEGNNKAYIIESKQWNDSYIMQQKYSKYREEGKTLHPQLQVFRHCVAFKDYLSVGEAFDEVCPILYVKNATQRGTDYIKKDPSAIDSNFVPVYTDFNEILDMISNELVDEGHLSIEELKNASYLPSKSIIKAMNSIVTHEMPFILTDEQEKAVKTIESAINSGKKIIQIKGVAGSGKTALLLNLYVHYLNKIDKQDSLKPYFVSGAQNTALYRSIYKKVEKSFSYSLPIQKECQKKPSPENIYLMDEAQHNAQGVITDIVNSGSVVVLCYDVNQTINANNSIEELKSLESRSDFVSIELKCTVRYNGSSVYEKNVNAFLTGRNKFLPDELFDFKAFNSLDEILEATDTLLENKKNCTVAVIGLLSSDSDDIVKLSNGRLFTKWGDKEEVNWIPYILERDYKNKNNGSIWVGTWWLPGLDVDYVVLLGGGDVKITSNGLVANPKKAKHYRMMVSIAETMQIKLNGFTFKQKIDNLFEYFQTKEGEHRYGEFIGKFSELLRNNYYIMMTRAKKGCYVWFSDNENTYKLDNSLK